ncbi:MAG: hypothetical protein PHZ03_06815 [Syntrophomonas sp.]|nr:hypothetical protein [Syntrophomonas sp.]
MTQDIRLWSPVIVASLAAPRICQRESRFGTDQIFKRMEDIKVKIKNPRAEWQGKILEARMNLEIIALLEDHAGHTQLISRQEIIKDRVALGEFDRSLEQDEDAVFIIQIQDLKWDGEMQGNELIISYSLSYVILAAREQVVKLYANEEMELSNGEQENDLQGMEMGMEMEIDRVRNDNERLNRKLFLYERDLMSLQRGIKKAENRNVALSSELSGARELVKKLRDAITRKDLLICAYENPQNETRKKTLPLLAMGDEESKLGQRIKRMLMNSL